MPKPSSKWTESYLNRKQILGKYLRINNNHENRKKNNLSSRSLQPTIKDYLPTVMCLLCGNDLESKSISKQNQNKNNPNNSNNNKLSSNLNLNSNLCSSCLSSPLNAINSIYSRMNHLDKIEKNHRLICRTCCNIPQIEELFVNEILEKNNHENTTTNIFLGKDCCVSTDCPIFFERYRSITKRENIQLSILLLTDDNQEINR